MRKPFGLLQDRVNIKQEIRRYLLLLLLPVVACLGLYVVTHYMIWSSITASASQSVEKLYLQISSMQHEVEITELALQSDLAAISNMGTSEYTETKSDTDSELTADSNANQESNSGANLIADSPRTISTATQISIRMQGCDYIEHIYYVDYEKDRIYSDLGTFTMSSLTGILRSLSVDEDYFGTIEESEWNMSISTHLTEPYFISPCRSDDGEIIGRFIVTIDLEVLMTNVFSPATWFFCLYNDDFFLASQTISVEFTLSDLESGKAVSQLLGQAVQCFYTTVDDYTCLVAIPQKDYYYPFVVLFACFVVYVLLISGIGFGYLYHVSRKRYIEMSGLMDILPQNENACAYRDLIPAVRTAMLDANSREKDQRQQLQEHSLYNVLHNFYAGTEIGEQLEQLGIPADGVIYYVAVFTIQEIDNIALVMTDKADRRRIPRTIFSVALGQICPEELQSLSCGDADSFIALFYCAGAPREEIAALVQRVCRNLCQFMLEGYGIRTHIAISSQVTDYRKLPEAFDQAKKLEQFSATINSTSDMICEEQLTESTVLTENNFISQEQLLVNTLMIEKYEAVPAIVKTILSEQVAALSSEYKAADHRLQIVSGLLVEWLHEQNLKGIDTGDAIARLLSATSIDALNTEVEQIFSSIKAEETMPSEVDRKVAEACDYIARHLDDPNLNVPLICDSVGTIPQRLIPLFQEEFHMGIAEYVNDRRIERAKELLISTKQTVRQISENVGYATTDTFVRNFKKREKFTPTEFRKLKANQA